MTGVKGIYPAEPQLTLGRVSNQPAKKSHQRSINFTVCHTEEGTNGRAENCSVTIEIRCLSPVRNCRMSEICTLRERLAVERKVTVIEIVAASAVFIVVGIVLYIVFSYKPA